MPLADGLSAVLGNQSELVPAVVVRSTSKDDDLDDDHRQCHRIFRESGRAEAAGDGRDTIAGKSQDRAGHFFLGLAH